MLELLLDDVDVSDASSLSLTASSANLAKSKRLAGVFCFFFRGDDDSSNQNREQWFMKTTDIGFEMSLSYRFRLVNVCSRENSTTTRVLLNSVMLVNEGNSNGKDFEKEFLLMDSCVNPRARRENSDSTKVSLELVVKVHVEIYL